MSPVARVLHVCSAVLAILVSTHGAGAESRSPVFDAVAFDRFMASHLNRTGIPGISVAITDGSTVTMIKGYGRDGRGAPMTERTPVFIGSLSKSITAVAVLQLVEQGQIALDAPVHDYLPEFKLADSRYLQITVRQLLNQNSGMSDRTYYEWLLHGPRSLVEAVRGLDVASLVAPPGSEFNYHNRNYDVAARLVEVVSGERFSQYLRNHVFVPLGMHNARLVENLDDPNDEIPPGHVFAFGRPIAVSAPSFFLSGSGGVVASAADMAQWLLFNATGGVTAEGTRLLSEANVNLMHQASGTDGRYGFGWFDRSSGQPPRFLHNGWTPTFTAFQSLSLDGRHDMAILSNGARTLMRGSDAPYVFKGIQASEAGGSPKSFGESTRDLDLVFTAGALLALTVAARAFRRTLKWEERGSDRRLWRRIVGLALPGMVLSVIVSLPKLAGDAMGGRETNWAIVVEPGAWIWMFYVSPVGVVTCVLVGLCCLLVLVARTIALVRATRRSGVRI